jgi:hypothetical protein
MVAWDTIINLDKPLFAHKSNLNPVLAARRNNWHTLLLWVDPLPDVLVCVAVLNESVFAHLELRGCPLGVGWHAKAQV